MKLRPILAILFSLLLFSAAFSQSSRVREIAPGVFVWLGDREKRQPANCGWVELSDYVLVIDANFPWGAREIIPEIKRTTRKPIRFVFNTHYHGDHAFGGDLFAKEGAAIVCSQDCGLESRTKGQAGWDRNTETGEFSLKPYKLAHPSIVFPERMVFDDGKHRVELIRVGPGHSKGDAVAYLPKQRILFTGDLCVNWKSGNNVADADADPENWVRALEKMAGWDVGTVVVGHGAIGDKGTLRGQAGYLEDMWKQVRAGKRSGKSADQLVKEIDLSRHGHFAADAERNAVSIRAMYAKAGG